VGFERSEEVARELGWPVIVKPNKQGSTIGLSVVRGPEGFEAALQKAQRHDDEVMIERFVAGREFTVGILDGDALPVGEIVVANEVFDYQSKYQAGGAREIFPAAIPAEGARRMQDYALRVHRALGSGFPNCSTASAGVRSGRQGSRPRSERQRRQRCVVFLRSCFFVGQLLGTRIPCRS